jgi:hypothetical protein
MEDKKQPRSVETTAGMLIQHLNKVGVAQMDDNIVQVIHGIFGEIQPTGCMISSLAKNSRAMPRKDFALTVHGKRLQSTV